MKEKAIELHKKMKNTENVNKLWLYRWKKHHGILCDKIVTHSKSNDSNQMGGSAQHNDMQSSRKVLQNSSFEIETIVPETLTFSCCIM